MDPPAHKCDREYLMEQEANVELLIASKIG